MKAALYKFPELMKTRKLTEEERRSDGSEPKDSLPKKQSAGSRSLANSLNKTKESKEQDENSTSKT